MKHREAIMGPTQGSRNPVFGTTHGSVTQLVTNVNNSVMQEMNTGSVRDFMEK